MLRTRHGFDERSEGEDVLQRYAVGHVRQVHVVHEASVGLEACGAMTDAQDRIISHLDVKAQAG